MNSFNTEHKRVIKNIMLQQDALSERKAEIAESVKALADQLAIKPAEINKVIALVRKEEAQKGTLAFNQEILDLAVECV